MKLDDYIDFQSIANDVGIFDRHEGFNLVCSDCYLYKDKIIITVGVSNGAHPNDPALTYLDYIITLNKDFEIIDEEQRS